MKFMKTVSDFMISSCNIKSNYYELAIKINYVLKQVSQSSKNLDVIYSVIYLLIDNNAVAVVKL